MQLPSIDRSPNLRPAGADTVSSGGSKVIPLAPVNPSGTASAVLMLSAESQANVIKAAEAVHLSVQDPVQSGADVTTGNKDWTVRKPESVKPLAEPPKEPISKMLIELIQSMWSASARAVDLLQVQNPAQTQNPNDAPGAAAKEVLTYSPSKIKKSDSI
jgi:hypothetical protein